jgi:Ca2+-transporting ATPase
MLCTGLLLAAVFVPGLRAVLQVVDPGKAGWILIIGLSLIPLVIGQILKEVNVIRHSSAGGQWRPSEG